MLPSKLLFLDLALVNFLVVFLFPRHLANENIYIEIHLTQKRPAWKMNFLFSFVQQLFPRDGSIWSN